MRQDGRVDSVVTTGLFTLGGLLVGAAPPALGQWFTARDAAVAREGARRDAVVAAYRDVLAEIDHMLALQGTKRAAAGPLSNDLIFNRKVIDDQLSALERARTAAGHTQLIASDAVQEVLAEILSALPYLMTEQTGMPAGIDDLRNRLVLAMRADLQGL